MLHVHLFIQWTLSINQLTVCTLKICAPIEAGTPVEDGGSILTLLWGVPILRYMYNQGCQQALIGIQPIKQADVSCTLKICAPIEDGDTILKLLQGVSYPETQRVCIAE